MNIAFLGTHFPSHYHGFCRQLKSLGATVQGIGGGGYERLLPQIHDSLHEHDRVEDMHEHATLVRACGSCTHLIGF
jgi:hypothetical protein